ncbi:MAG: amidase [Telmatospirillum sp.]|jgi:aspartyl-tRNA(Asn)/glutamyl-tRNA(Gln) amidotransferase subunit A|nr:amidase [Telmatospirillum sp.]
MASHDYSREMSEELHWLGIAELHAAFGARRTSPVEVVEALLRRIERLDEKLHVFVTLDAENARKAARAAEQDIEAGRHKGPLHGIPIAIKDVIDAAGLPTTCQSKIFEGNIPSDDATSVAQLRRAGAIVLGKVATYEFALGGPSFDLPYPPARNPWHVDHSTGGSSSGSGVGLAAGLFPGALGTDTAGSVRNPASACGIVGLKPTYGRVSRQGVFPLAFTMDHVGPMARRVADIEHLLAAMADRDAPYIDAATDAAVPHRPADLRGKRIGFVRHFHERDMPADNEVAAALELAARVFEEAGAEIVNVSLPPLDAFAAVNRIILQAEAWAVHASWLRTRPQDYAKLTRQRLLGGAFLSAEDYVQAQRRRRRMIAAMEDVFRDVDLLLCASAMDPPCRIDDAEAVARTYPRQARTPFSVTGHPALAMMSGLSSASLPLSLQLAGRYWDEASVLSAAAVFERETQFYRHRPTLE